MRIARYHWSHFIGIFFLDQQYFYHRFYLRSLCYLVSGSLSPKQCYVWVPIHGAGFKSNQQFLSYFQEFCATIALVSRFYHTLQAEHTLGQSFCRCFLIYLSPLLVCREYLPGPMTIELGMKAPHLFNAYIFLNKGAPAVSLQEETHVLAIALVICGYLQDPESSTVPALEDSVGDKR